MTAGVKLKKADVEKALRATHGNYQLSGQMLKCTRQGIKFFVDKHPDLQAIVKEEREGVVDVAEGALQRAVLDGQAWAVQFTLRNLGRDRGYFEKTQQEISGPNGGDIRITTLSDERLAELLMKSRKPVPDVNN